MPAHLIEGDTCKITGCTNDRAIMASGRRSVCAAHYMRKARTGTFREADPIRPITLDPEAWVSYTVAHNRVKNARGKASEHSCVDCGGQAGHWSYTGNALHEFSGDGRGRRWSGDPDDYAPRCITCHRTFDQQKEMSDA